MLACTHLQINYVTMADINSTHHTKKSHLIILVDSSTDSSQIYSTKHKNKITRDIIEKYNIGVSNITCIGHDVGRIIVGKDDHGNVETRDMRTTLGSIFLGFPQLPAAILYTDDPFSVSIFDVQNRARIIDYTIGNFNHKTIVKWVGKALSKVDE